MMIDRKDNKTDSCETTHIEQATVYRLFMVERLLSTDGLNQTKSLYLFDA